MGQTPKLHLPYPEITDPADVPADLAELALAIDGAAVPALVTALPASPADGQKVYYVADATAGIVWHLRYRAASPSTYKWEVVGGPPLAAAIATGEVPGVGDQWVDLATPGPQLTTPLAGDYDVAFSAAMTNSGGTAGQYIWYLGTKIGGAAVAVVLQRADHFQGAATVATHLARTYRQAIGAGVAVKVQYNLTRVAAVYSDRRLTLMPVRVGSGA